MGVIDEELELLNKNTLILPRGFPDDAKEDVLKYTEYLSALKNTLKVKEKLVNNTVAPYFILPEFRTNSLIICK